MGKKGSAPFNWDPMLMPLGAITRERPIRARNGVPGKPYVWHARDDEGAALEAAARLAAIRAKLPPEWHAWHAALPPVQAPSGMGMTTTELRWTLFWREAV